MKTIQVTETTHAAKELIKHLVERKRNQLGIPNLDSTKAIRAINGIMQSQLDANQYQLFRKLLKGNRNPTFAKLIDLANAIDPTANINITVE
jgi:uncharacterized protein Yka (UPF0111/DUF47 family)